MRGGRIQSLALGAVLSGLVSAAVIGGLRSPVTAAPSMMSPMMTTNLSGQQLFTLACASCHGPAGVGRVFRKDGQTIKVPAVTYAELSGMYTKNFDEQLRTALVKGLDEEGKPLNPMMPRWTMFSTADVDKLIAYMKTLK